MYFDHRPCHVCGSEADSEAMHRMLTERGWDVFTATPYYLPSRTFFLCLPA